MLETDAWRNQKYRDQLFIKQDDGPPFFKNNSFSGHEPNHLFLNDSNRYWDATSVSDADHKGDGRGFAKVDLNDDGWLDIALVSTNKPRLKLLRNQLGDVSKNQRHRILLRGGQRGAATMNQQLSNRDGIGAKLIATYKSGRKQLLHRQSGEGNAAQNSRLIWLGFTPEDPVVDVEVLWPSGRKQRLTDLKVDQINIIDEN